MKNKKRIILLIAIFIILFTIIVAFFVKGNIFTKIENKNISEKNKTKEELDSRISNEKTTEVQEDQKTDVKVTEESKTVEGTKENATTPSTNTTTNNQTTSQNQPAVQEKPKTSLYSCGIWAEKSYEYFFESQAECEDMLSYSDSDKFAFDYSLDAANATIPEKYKKYFYFKYLEREAYYVYTVIDNGDDTKSVTYSPRMGTHKKPGLLLDVIGTFESFNTDWENKPAGSYETYRVKHYQVVTQFIQI